MATTTVDQAREALGQRLRDARRDAGLTRRQLATLAGWHISKVSKIEYGKQAPAEAAIRAWCRLCSVAGRTDNLIIAARDLEIMYVEWRRRLRTGTKARQTKSLALENDAQLLRVDDRLVQVEGISAGLSITQPREVALYIHSFNEVAKLAVYGAAARKIVVEEIERLG